MNFYITEQLIFFVKSIFLGVFVGLFFDFFKILRLIKKHTNVLVLVEDILFFFVTAVLTYCFMVDVSFGQIRFFIILGQIIGFILYKICFSNVVVKFFVFVVLIIKNILGFIYKFFIFPVYDFVFKVIVSKFLKILLGPIVDCLIKYFKVIKILLKNKFDIVYSFFKTN